MQIKLKQLENDEKKLKDKIIKFREDEFIIKILLMKKVQQKKVLFNFR